MSSTPQASFAFMSPRHHDGRWRLFVDIPGAPAETWPQYVWPDNSPIPTPAQRCDALVSLGYQPVAGAQWTWWESNPDPRTKAVRLLAGIDVHPIGGAA